MTFGSAAVRVLTATLFAMAAQSFGQEFAPFVIPAESAPDSPIAFRGRPIGADSPRMTVRDGHFFVGDRRFRAWGVNLCYGANFPPHDQAERMAAHLEAFGVNTVRFHHMDCEWFRFPRSIWDADEPTKLSAEALDRLDYFIDRLARRGIHANLNLHVSRIHSRHLGLPDTKATGSYDKMVDIFTPKLIEAQKEYARSLLTRVNRYRGMRYADDPAVAFVEINNEDSLFLWNWQENLRNMAPPYAEILRGRYNEWLRACYGSTGKLAAAWKVPGGADEKPVSTRLPLAGKGASWTLTRHSGADAQAQPLRDADGVRLTPGKLASAVWHLEYSVAGLEARTDRFYTLRFRARSDAPRQIVCRFGQADAPYRSLGLRINVAIDKTWREHRFEFQPPQAESNARVSFLFAQSAAPFEIADVELVSQPIAGLRDGESLVKATVALLATGESQARLLDRLRFLAETEKRYYDDFRKFLKDDLGCKALVTGTMVNGPLGLWAQSDMDYLDTHAYWSHPSFPKGWNRKNWSMDQKAMTDLPRNNVLSQVAACRLAGKPLTLSEYNHPAPNDAQAECVPMVAAMAAAQDWDGVWLFAFTDRGEGWDAGAFDGWFDFAGNPSKWGFVPLGAAIFRDGGIEPLPKGKVYPLAASPDPLGELAALHFRHDHSLLGALAEVGKASAESAWRERMYVSLAGPAPAPRGGADSATAIAWADGRFEAAGRGGRVVIDTAGDGTSSLRTDRAAFAVLAAAAMDAQALPQSRKVLFALCGRCENTGMEFSADRRTVSDRWGTAPVRIERVSAEFDWPAAPGRTLHPLGPDGAIGPPLPIPTVSGPTIRLTLPGTSGTLWYLLKSGGD